MCSGLHSFEPQVRSRPLRAAGDKDGTGHVRSGATYGGRIGVGFVVVLTLKFDPLILLGQTRGIEGTEIPLSYD